MVKLFNDIKKVWRVTRKPSQKEFLQNLKIIGLGFVVIGTIGFIVYLIWHLFLRYLFGGTV